ncbi:MAG: hypothetical protein WBO24_02275 [Nitrospirales bacterium]
MTEMLGLPPPLLMWPVAGVRVEETSLDYFDADGDITPQHYAFLVGANEFDQIFERSRARRFPYWADPHKKELNTINTLDDGRGLILTIRTGIFSNHYPSIWQWGHFGFETPSFGGIRTGSQRSRKLVGLGWTGTKAKTVDKTPKIFTNVHGLHEWGEYDSTVYPWPGRSLRTRCP